MSDLTPDEIEAIFLQLDAEDRAAHIGAAWVARAGERRRQEALPQSCEAAVDPPTCDSVSPAWIEQRAARSRRHDIDDDLIGCSIARELIELGQEAQTVALLIAEAGIAWRPRTAEERLIAAAAELLSYGVDPDTVQQAFAALEAS